MLKKIRKRNGTTFRLVDILEEIYRKNRRLIMFYVILSLFLSFFLYAAVGISTGIKASESDILSEDAARQEPAMNTEEDAARQEPAMNMEEDAARQEPVRDMENPALYGGDTGIFLSSAANTMGISLDPAVLLGMVAGISILQENEIWVDGVEVPDFGIFDHWWVRIVVFIWAAVALSPTLFGDGMEEINTKYVGPIALLSLEVALILETGDGFVANAADGNEIAVAAAGILSALLEFIKMIGMLVCYVSVRVMVFFLDIIISLASKLNPVVSGIFKLAKIGITTGYMTLARDNSTVFYVCAIPVVVASFFFFKLAYTTIRYFKHIYIRPFFLGIFARKKKQPLLHKRAPGFLKRQMEQDATPEIKMIVPAFSIKHIQGNHILKNKEMWWLVVSEREIYLTRKRFFWKEPQKFVLRENGIFAREILGGYPDSPPDIFIRGAGLFRGSYCELFTLYHFRGKAFSGNKIMRLVFSKEYMNQYEEIRQMMNLRDYDAVMREIKVEEKEERKKKRDSWFSARKGKV
ncbi:MAG: hypothetical protein ACI4DU_01320 [Lachnospiraceae bacterium]